MVQWNPQPCLLFHIDTQGVVLEAQATLGRGKGGDGLKSVEWWQQGLVDKVREYCIEDVRITRQIFEYALEHNAVKYMDFKTKREIKLNTDSWLKPNEPISLTHTLPF